MLAEKKGRGDDSEEEDKAVGNAGTGVGEDEVLARAPAKAAGKAKVRPLPVNTQVFWYCSTTNLSFFFFCGALLPPLRGRRRFSRGQRLLAKRRPLLLNQSTSFCLLTHSQLSFFFSLNDSYTYVSILGLEFFFGNFA